MRVTLVSRYPRVDTPVWKRRLGKGLLDDGVELSVVYSRSSIREHAVAGLRELGPAAVAQQLQTRISQFDGSSAKSDTETLASWARKRGLPVRFFSRLQEPACLCAIRDLAPDILVLAGADIAPAAMLQDPRIAAINAHYGLLPRYRGMNVTEWSIYHDDPIGVTIHVVDAGIDTGDLLLREEIGATPGDTLATLRRNIRKRRSVCFAYPWLYSGPEKRSAFSSARRKDASSTACIRSCAGSWRRSSVTADTCISGCERVRRVGQPERKVRVAPAHVANRCAQRTVSTEDCLAAI